MLKLERVLDSWWMMYRWDVGVTDMAHLPSKKNLQGFPSDFCFRVLARGATHPKITNVSVKVSKQVVVGEVVAVAHRAEQC